MPPKRRATAPLTARSTCDEVMQWFGDILKPEELQKVISALKASGEKPDGQVLLSCSAEELKSGLGIPSWSICKKIKVALQGMEENSPPNTDSGTKQVKVKAEPLTQTAVHASCEEAETTATRRRSNRRQEVAALGEHAMPLASPLQAEDVHMAQAEGTSHGEASKGGGSSEEEEEEEDYQDERQPGSNRRQRQLRMSGGSHRQTARRKAEEAFLSEKTVRGQASAMAAGAGAGTAGGMATRTRAARARADAAAGGTGTVFGGVPGAGNVQHDQQQAATFRLNNALRRKWGLEEIFKLMPLDELRALVEDPEYDFDFDILQRKKRVDGEWVDVLYDSVGKVAPRMARYMACGTLDEKDNDRAGWKDEEIDLFLRRHCDAAVKQYVDEQLKLEYAVVPENIEDAHKLMWTLWDEPEPLELQKKVLLGTYTFKIKGSIGQHSKLDNFQVDPSDGTISFKKLCAELCDQEDVTPVIPRQIELENFDEDAEILLINLNILSNYPRWSVRAKVDRRAVEGGRTVQFLLYTKFQVVNGCWESCEPGKDAVYSVDYAVIMGCMDHVKGTPTEGQLQRMADAYDAATEQVLDIEIDDRIRMGQGLTLPQFDKIMSLVEDQDHPEPEGLEQQCQENMKLALRPYQRRSIAFMLNEERAEGGSARNLWVKMSLPDRPDLVCYVSPILHQVRISTSKVEVEQSVSACGGSGWLALQMGLGKTACAIGAILLNPPSQDWREEGRTWRAVSDDDYLSAKANNMPRGGTLVIAPSSLLCQWEDEIEKTSAVELTVYDWGDRLGTRDPRTVDCRELAGYDVVLATPALAATKHTLNNIYWHRIIVDEAQLNMGGFLADSNHLWLAKHRWIMTGTPINASVDTIAPSLDFLKLGGGFNDCYKYLPPVMAHVLQCAMVRYTKDGRINGELNLPLPKVTHRTVVCRLSPEDDSFYDQEEVDARNKLLAQLERNHIDPETGRHEDDYEYKKERVNMGVLRRSIAPVRKSAAGALKHKTGQYEMRGDRCVEEKWLNASKAEALIQDLAELKEDEPDSKVLIFSEWPDALRQVRDRLSAIGLQYRALLSAGGSSKTKGRAIRAFQTDPPYKVFLLTHTAGGAGITLTSATHVYIMEPALNLSFEKQAIGRTVRMGQDKPVTVTRLVMKGTIEERLVKLLARKRKADPLTQATQLSQFASTAAEANPAANDEGSKLTLEDVQELLEKRVAVKEEA